MADLRSKPVQEFRQGADTIGLGLTPRELVGQQSMQLGPKRKAAPSSIAPPTSASCFALGPSPCLVPASLQLPGFHRLGFSQTSRPAPGRFPQTTRLSRTGRRRDCFEQPLVFVGQVSTRRGLQGLRPELTCLGHTHQFMTPIPPDPARPARLRVPADAGRATLVRASPNFALAVRTLTFFPSPRPPELEPRAISSGWDHIRAQFGGQGCYHPEISPGKVVPISGRVLGIIDDRTRRVHRTGQR